MDNQPTSNFDISATDSAPVTPPLRVSNHGGDKWKSIAIIAIVLALLFAVGGVLGILHYKNKYRDAQDTIAQLEADNANLQSQLDNQSWPEEETDVFTIDEWGVQFTVPEGLSVDDLTYNLSDDENTASLVVNGATTCVTDNVYGLLVRHDMDMDLTSEYPDSTVTPLTEGGLGDGYYYYLVQPTSVCPDGSDDTVADEIAGSVLELAQSIEAVSDDTDGMDYLPEDDSYDY